ncbi:IS3 family transposase [Serratia sp. UGAL515B_01]|uniref:IS3 family transposase n=1 Tax=Serratia sp. UGAL515B_01 TaxID=2986763 RepID=UPI0039884180
MRAKGCDNACLGNVFHSLKVECVHAEWFSSRETVQTKVFDYTERGDNLWCCHRARNNISLEQFESQHFT